MPRQVDGIIDEIDKLVDDSLAQPIVDDYHRNRYVKCGHCGRDFHGIPVTEKIAAMYEVGQFDENYRVDQDDTEILCPGSDFIGPLRSASRSAPLSPYERAQRQIAAINRTLQVLTETRRWWRTSLPGDATVRHDIDTVLESVTIEIDDQSETFNGEYVRARHIEHEEIHIFQSDAPTRVFSSRITMDVLSDYAPSIGGTWEPLTAPGVTYHPDDLRSVYTGQISSVRYSSGAHVTVDELDGREDIGHLADENSPSVQSDLGSQWVQTYIDDGITDNTEHLRSHAPHSP